jgi:hypothetical protein
VFQQLQFNVVVANVVFVAVVFNGGSVFFWGGVGWGFGIDGWDRLDDFVQKITCSCFPVVSFSLD